MQKSIPIHQAYEFVSDYIYGLGVPDQVDIVRDDFFVDVQDTDDGVVYEGSLITDSQFESILTTVLENSDDETITRIYGDLIGFETEFDGDDVVWDDDDYESNEM